MTVECHPIVDHEEWLAWRRQDITASRSGALFDCEMPGNTTPLRLWAEHRGVEFAPVTQTNRMRRGLKLERLVGEEVEEARPGWKTEPVAAYFRDPVLRLGATPDFWILGDPRGRGVLQAKTVDAYFLARDWHGGAFPPEWIMWQVRTEMLLTNAAFGVVAALEPSNWNCHIIEVAREPEAERQLVNAVRKFWHCVDNDIEPEPDFARDADVIKALYRHEQPGNVADLTGNNELPELLAARASMQEIMKDHKKRCEAIEAQLKHMLGNAEQAVGLDGWRITFKTEHVDGYQVKPRDSRVLRITDKRAKDRP